MLVKIKSPALARRLRGMGGTGYGIDMGSGNGFYITCARHFSPKGHDFDKLCREGRLWVEMGERSNQENRRLVKREFARQIRLNQANALVGLVDPSRNESAQRNPAMDSFGADPVDSYPKDEPKAAEDYVFIPFDG